jgi:hypothetical protein
MLLMKRRMRIELSTTRHPSNNMPRPKLHEHVTAVDATSLEGVFGAWRLMRMA